MTITEKSLFSSAYWYEKILSTLMNVDRKEFSSYDNVAIIQLIRSRVARLLNLGVTENDEVMEIDNLKSDDLILHRKLLNVVDTVLSQSNVTVYRELVDRYKRMPESH